MSYRVRVEVGFAAGHRLLGHPGPCAAPHGHTFRAEIVLEAAELDAQGMVADFTDIKARLRGWVEANWDHGFVVGSADTALLAALRAVPGAKVYTIDANPTTEALARELFIVATREFGELVRRVRVWEGETHYAEFGEPG